MTAEPRESPVTEAVRSLEVRWIFPGQLDAAVARWFGRFPVRMESREDTYLLDPPLPGLSVKIRGGGALEVKAYRGSPGILEVAGRARGHMESWQKWSFPFSPLSRDDREAASWRPVRKRRRIGCLSRASGQSWQPSRGGAGSHGARWNSPRSAPLARTGGPWDSKQPAPPARSAANSRPPPRSCSPRPCPVMWNPAQMNPGPMRSGWASGPAPKVTPAPKTAPLPSRLARRSARHTGTGPTENASGDITAAITSRDGSTNALWRWSTAGRKGSQTRGRFYRWVQVTLDHLCDLRRFA
jgi:hypothetical protein